MDRIRKALDLARQERSNRSVSFDESVAQKPEPKIGPARLPTSIVYSQTRVFTPHPVVLEANRIVDPASADPAASAYRSLRTQVLQRMDENGWRSLAILSPNSNDGKTTTAINLAVSLGADQCHTVLLVDCDLKRPRIAACLGLEPEYGFDDLLSGSARMDQCLYHPVGFDRLVVLPVRAGIDNSSEVLSGPRGRDFISELRARYPERIILFDLPPILGADDALAALPLIECGLVVVAEAATPRGDLLRSMELLRKTPILGTVLNRAAAVVSAYG